MNPTYSDSGIHKPLSPAPEQSQSEEAPTGVSAGRDVTLYHNNNSPFLHLPELTQLKIIRCLGFRDITRLAEVCRYFHDLVQENNALGRAWNRRFPSPYLYQLKTTIKTKDGQQLRDWFKPMANTGTVESLIERRKNIYFPVQLLFTNSKLMSQSKEFELVEKAVVRHDNTIYCATFSPDGQHLATASRDQSAKIYALQTNGSWQKKATITHNNPVGSVVFSPDGRYLVTAGWDGKAKIYGLEDDGSWEEKACIFHENMLNSAKFSADGRRVVTVSLRDSVKIIHREDNGSWQVEDTIHIERVYSAKLSSNGRHLVVFGSATGAAVEVYGQSAAGSWVVTSTINLRFYIRSGNLSADSCHLAIITYSYTAIIFELQADGSWKKMGSIEHDKLITSAKFSPDSLHLMTTSQDGTAKIYSQNAGSWEQKACIVHHGVVESACFSADCQHVLTIGADATAKIHSLQTDGSWQPKANIVHQDEILSAAFSPDACHLVTYSNDGMVRILGHEANGSWLQKAAIRNSIRFRAACFSADSRNVAAISLDLLRITELWKKD
ncbi:F-box/WD repeat-containing protein [Endozoicomonas sp. 8E]|uniref:F-box/WD repeat-containing protein n=1 Tax=Endozoicomonas sp. 8E TaxID=3035692 RepID=UPI00293921A4|nr:F-box-like domain-containing protein [Endozoicomonas sp. 8E]WOG28294.1 hypothetical protein P6910_01190 [Endozoicomonas sp. 8E]